MTLSAALTAAVMLLVLALVLFHHHQTLVASNSRIGSSAYAVSIGPGQTRCQAGEYVPQNAAEMQLYPALAPAGGGPPLLLAFRVGTSAFTTRVRGAYPAGTLPIGLPRHPTLQLARLCITNEGHTPASFEGNYTSANPAEPAHFNGPGERRGDEVRANYLRTGRPTWLALTGTILARAALFRAGIETPALIAAVIALLIATLLIAVVFVVRQLGRAA